MKHKESIPRPVAAMLQKAGRAWLAAFALLTVSVVAMAQVTTSDIRGTISAPDGNPAPGAVVRITDTRTGRSKVATTSDSGRFSIGDLSVGGPYTVTITSQYAAQSVTDIFVELGETFDFSLTLTAESIEEITVTAQMVDVVQTAVGPSSTFTYDDLQNLPSINRDIRDIVRVDPRVYIDEAFVDAVQCVGANPRFNSLTVDGIKMNDNFGLNSNGYPTQRMPFPYDAVQNVALELSPFDVQYGGFTACNINAVTRSGTNEFDGRVWMDYTDADLTGDSLEGDSLPQGDFDETRWGVSFGGPIIQDKLFFFAAYEKADGADTFDRCAGDQSCGRPVEGVTQAQLDRIANIARTIYSYEPGETILSAPNEDEKFLLRLDWNLNEDHNAAFTYNYNDGFNITQSDSDSDEFEFSNHFYERGAEINSYSVQLFSNWTESFSTELRVGYTDLDNRQNTINNVFMGEMQIETYADVDGDGSFSRAIVYLGGDDSRQSNDLNYDTSNIKLVGTWTTGDHIISAGFEQEEIDIFNLFLQHTIGEYRFDEENTDINGATVGCSFGGNPDGCIDQFEALSPDDIYYGNAAPSLDPNDAAAEFKYATNSLYLQDEYTFADVDLTIVAGLRYDWYTSDDFPTENANFIARSGFTNRQNFDGESLLQPRLGFNWDVNNDIAVRGGFGLYSGGNPNVWLGNNYQNDGITQVQGREFNAGLSDLNVDPARFLGAPSVPLGQSGGGNPVFDAPQALIDFVATGTANSSVNALDPDYSIPSNWKISLGGTWNFDGGFMGDGYTLNADILYTRAEDSSLIVDDTYVQISTAPDGRPVYYQADKSIAGCDTDPVGTGSSCSRLFNGDFILTNVQGDDAEATSISLSLSKAHDFGLDWTFGYAWTDADDISPMTSSVAFSNYFNISVRDPNRPDLSVSNYDITNRFVLRMNYAAEWFGDYQTRFSLVGSSNEGRPYSVTFSEQAMFVRGSFFPDDDRSLFYMPAGGDSDPIVQYDPGFDAQAFAEYAARTGLNKYEGRIVPRNALTSDWWTKFDVRVTQELPGFTSDHRANVYFVIENIGNLLNDDWGVLYERSFPRAAPIVEASYLDPNGTPDDYSDDIYLFENFIDQSQSRSSGASLWSLRFGFNYNF